MLPPPAAPPWGVVGARGLCHGCTLGGDVLSGLSRRVLWRDRVTPPGAVAPLEHLPVLLQQSQSGLSQDVEHAIYKLRVHPGNMGVLRFFCWLRLFLPLLGST